MTSEQSLTSRDFPVHWPVQTRWTDNDMFGHLNNAVYYALFDTAINAWINTSCGIDPLTVPWLGVVAESGCRYFVRVEVSRPTGRGLAVTRLGNSSVTYRLAIFGRSPHDAVAARRPLGARVRRPRHPQAGARFRTPSARCWKRRAWSSRYARPMPLVSKTVEVDGLRRVDHGDRRRLRVVPAVERGDQGLLGAGPLRRRPAQPAAARRRRAGPVGHVHHGGLLPGAEPDLHGAAAGRSLREAGAEVLGGADRADVAADRRPRRRDQAADSRSRW